MKIPATTASARRLHPERGAKKLEGKLEMQPVPEQFAKPPEVRGGERRQRARHSPSALTYVSLGENNGGIIANISETGMYVTAGQPLRENFFSRVSFKIPQTDRAIETQAEVVWTSESKKEAGVRFVELREEGRDLIRKWVAPARRNGGGTARPAENPREANNQVKLTPPPAPTPPPASESASAERAAHSNHDPVSAEPREVIPATAPETYVPREPERVPAAVARSIAVSEKDAPPQLAFSGLGPRAWELTEAQRAEFERLFPSENAGAAAHEAVMQQTDIVAPAEPQPIAERFDSYAVRTFDAPREETSHENFAIAESQAAQPAPAVESEATIERETSEAPPVAHAIPPAAPRTPTQSLWDAPPPMMESVPNVARPFPEEAPAPRSPFAGAVSRTPAQSLWDAPPPMMQPIIGGSYGRSYGSTYGAPAADPLEDGRSRSTWSVATVAILVVAACFVLGFLVGPDGMRAWPKVDAARRVVVAELGHLKSVVTNNGVAGPNTVTAPAVSSNPAPTGQNAPASASATPTAPTAPATGAPTVDEPAQAAPAAPAPSATGPATENSATDESASSASSGTDSDNTRNAADMTSASVPAPKRTESVPAATSKKSDSERRGAEAARTARAAEIEKERAAAAEAYAEERAAASAAHEAAQPTTPAVTSEAPKPATSNPPSATAP
ncbi:MAG: PilZ domain-containing protein, partial [Candidatus Acidiferrales bacterium]